MSANVREYRRNVTMQAIGRVLYMSVGSAVFIAATHVMSVESVASYALVLTLLSVVWAMADLGTTATLGVMIVGAPEQRSQTLGAFLRLRFALACVAGALGAMAAPFIVTPNVLSMTLVACALTPLLAARFYEPVFQAMQRPGRSGMLGATYVAVLVPLASAALLLAPTHPEVLIAAHIAAGTLNGALGLWLIHRLVPIELRPRTETILWLLRHALPVGTASLLATFNVRAGIIFLKYLSGPDAVANFVAAQRFLDLGVAVAVTAVTPLVTIFGRLATSNSSGKTAARILTVTTWVVAPTPVLACFWSAPVVGILYGADLQESAEIVPLIALQFTLFAMATSVSPWILATLSPRELRILVWGPAAALVANLALCALLVRPMGAMGAAAAAAVGEALLVSVFLYMFHRRSGHFITGRAFLALGCALMLMAGTLGVPGWPLVGKTILGLLLYVLVALFSLGGVASLTNAKARLAMRAWLRERLP